MAEPWRTFIFRDWAERFLEEERVAGRTYLMVAVEHVPTPTSSMTRWELRPSDPAITAVEFRGLVLDYMHRHDWKADSIGIEAWAEDMEAAIMAFIREGRNGRWEA